MMHQFISAIDFIRNIVYNTFYYSFKAGQLLILGSKLFLDLFLVLLKGVNIFLIALSESFSVFSQDISHGIQHIAEFVAFIIQEFQKVANFMLFTSQTIFETLIVIHTFINNAIQSVLNVIVQTAAQFKRLVVLFGSGVWFVVTLLPIFLYNVGVYLISLILLLFNELGACIMHSVQNIKLIIREFYAFVTDVPVEAVIGILVTISLIYIITQFYMTIFTCITHQFFKLFIKLRRIFNHVRYFRLLSIPSNQRINNRRFPQVRRSLSTPSPHPKNHLNQSNDDRYCIICQERLKCILLLPCRHLCMCSECNVRLQLYNDSCPICRKDIEESMRVFV